MPQSSRIFGYDLLKALTMIGIVFYHLHSIEFDGVPEDGSTYYPGVGKFFYGLLSAGVPMFYMVNGAIVGNKNLTFKKCIKTASRLVAISIFWTVIFKWILFPLVFHEQRSFCLAELWEFYWFFYTFAFVYLVTWVLNRITWLRWFVLGSLVIFPFVTNFIWDIILCFSPETSLPSWGHSGAMTLYTIVYYYMGRYMANLHAPVYLSVISIAIGLVLVNFTVFSMTNAKGEVYDSVSSCLPTIGAMFVNTGFFFMLKNLSPSPSNILVRFFSFVGQRTLGVYLFHAFFVKLVLDFIWGYQNQNACLVLLLALFISTICSALWYYCPNVLSMLSRCI